MDDKSNMEALMVRILQGTATAKENAQFLSWLNDDNANEVLFFQMKEIYDSRRRVSVVGGQEGKPAASSVSRNRPSRSPRLPQRLFAAPWMRYAAIIAVVFGAVFLIHLVQEHKPAGSVVYLKQIVVHNTRGVYAVSLPDGSKVWLHGATTIVYPEQFSDSIRTVDLEGEAYFAVQANKARPFVVQTPTAKVRATGTEFNVTAYPGDQLTTTTLVKGVVDVQPNHRAESVQLKPGQQVMTGLTGSRVRVAPDHAPAAKTTAKKEDLQVVVQEINTDLYTDWKDGMYRFKNEPFQNIALRLEKMYGVEIRIENEDLKKAAFSGMFTTDHSLKEVLEIINISNPIVYSVKDKLVTINQK